VIARDEPSITDRDGIPWDQAPIPPRWHRCWPQTTIAHPLAGPAIDIGICACGGVSVGASIGPTWTRKNYRRRYTRGLTELPTIVMTLITTTAILFTLMGTPADTLGLIVQVALVLLLMFLGNTTGKYYRALRDHSRSNKRLDEAIKELESFRQHDLN
jgi:hypothetical protein